MLKAGIAGGSGYAGAELIHTLLGHPEVEVACISSETYCGEKIGSAHPHLAGLIEQPFCPLEELVDSDLDVLFLALPHGKAMQFVPQLEDDLLLIDLSGDFRIRDPQVFSDFYGFPMDSIDLQAEFVYGLTEINRSTIANAKRIANPGCFATATLIALYPLFQERWIEGPVFIDAKTGSSGSGRKPSPTTHHPRRSQSLFPYKPFRHQHLPEIKQVLSGSGNELIFQTYSAPLVRGIFTSHYMCLSSSRTAQEVHDLYADYFGTEPFVRWVTGCPDVSSVQHCNLVDIGCATDGNHLIIWSTLDNLQKGAAGQAVQNMNVASRFDETAGLQRFPAFP
jgi:N-acetyl-gamma-glutamyl-phosphate reductase